MKRLEMALTQIMDKAPDATNRTPVQKGRSLLCIALMLGIASALAGCASAPPTYELRSQTGLEQTRAPKNIAIAVTDPIASPALDSDRIVIRTGPDSLAYLANAQWTDTLSNLIRFRLIETLQKARVAQLVGPAGIIADYALVTTVRRFEVDVSKGLAEIEIAVSLNSDRTGRPVAAKVFKNASPAPTTADGAAAHALSEAFAASSAQIAEWVSSKI